MRKKRVGWIAAMAVALGIWAATDIAAEESEHRGPRPRGFGGTVSSADAGSVTFAWSGDGGRGGTRTLTIDGSTKILLETDQFETVPGEGGETRQRRVLAAGTAADLQTGTRIGGKELNGVATEIRVHLLRPKRGESEDNRSVSTPRPTRRRGEGEADFAAPRVSEPRRTGGEGDR